MHGGRLVLGIGLGEATQHPWGWMLGKASGLPGVRLGPPTRSGPDKASPVQAVKPADTRMGWKEPHLSGRAGVPVGLGRGEGLEQASRLFSLLGSGDRHLQQLGCADQVTQGQVSL